MGHILVSFNEASFRLVPVYKRVWFMKGQKPEGTFFWSNKKLSIFGALIGRKELFCEFYTSLNSATYLAFLDHFIKTLDKTKKYVFILDNAPYHKSPIIIEYLKSLNKHIKVEFLPPYSPELNPTETCWKILRHEVTNSTYFPSLNKMQEQIENFLTGHNFMLKMSNYLCR